MSFVQEKLIGEAFTPTDKTEARSAPSWSWAAIEAVLSGEWQIGGSTMPSHAIRGLVVGK